MLNLTEGNRRVTALLAALSALTGLGTARPSSSAGEASGHIPQFEEFSRFRQTLSGLVLPDTYPRG